MTLPELKKLIESACIDPFQYNDFTPISISQAKAWLQDIFKDQESSDLEPSERIPLNIKPEIFMYVWNDICVEHIRAKVSCPEVPVIGAFIGKKSYQIILIQQYGDDDYGAVWYDTYSVRGTLKDIVEEVKDEL